MFGVIQNPKKILSKTGGGGGARKQKQTTCLGSLERWLVLVGPIALSKEDLSSVPSAQMTACNYLFLSVIISNYPVSRDLTHSLLVSFDTKCMWYKLTRKNKNKNTTPIHIFQKSLLKN